MSRPLWQVENSQFNQSMESFDEITATSTSTSCKKYQVFINHRGPDVKKTLASVLYQFLSHMGLKVFLDSQELELGGFLSNNIERAIRICPVQIAIFSKTYATSSWCLAELSLMLKVKTRIIPVFYDVRPSDLRYIYNGTYSNAFRNYKEKGRHLDKLEEWKEALYKASFISGIEYRTDRDDDLGILCKDIVDAVLNETENFKYSSKLEVAEYPVGLDEAIEKLEILRGQNQDGKGKIIGIAGTGGVGKTALAKEFYNRNCHTFCRSSFLFRVREAHKNKTMAMVQHKLLCDLSTPHPSSIPPFANTQNRAFGLHLIKSQLESWCSESLFITLDDIDHVEQLEALAVNEFVKYGSLVIVTSRDVSVLQQFGIVNIYETKGLEEKYARELICLHAFGISHAPNGFEALVEDFLDVSGSLPLNLIKWGKHLDSVRSGKTSEQVSHRLHHEESIPKPSVASSSSSNTNLHAAADFTSAREDKDNLLKRAQDWFSHCYTSLGQLSPRIKRLLLTSTYRKQEKSSHRLDGIAEMGLHHVPREFTYREICASTKNFREKLGQGGFGDVFRGVMVKTNQEVAVKSLSASSRQGQKEFLAEINALGKLRHPNLVQLLGWCHEKERHLLVYEYMSNGNLDNLLFGNGRGDLDWTRRYRIACNIACSLLYLHELCDQQVVHRDIKSSNVLLDSEFTAKLSDFGLARLRNHDELPQTTRVAGTVGYLAPEYFLTGKAGPESDVFSFGAVALEIACGRRALDPSLEEDEMVLVKWVWYLYGEGRLFDAVDSSLNGEFDRAEIEQLMAVGLLCSHPDRLARPTARHVLQLLNFEVPMPRLPRTMPVPVYASHEMAASSESLSTHVPSTLT